MKYTIKKKLESLFSKELIKKEKSRFFFKFKITVFIYISSIFGLFIPAFKGMTYAEFISEDISKTSTLYLLQSITESLAIGASATLVSLFIILTLFYLKEKKEFFLKTIYKEEKDLKFINKEFGTVNNLMSIYNQLNKSNIDLTDENFNLMNKEPEEESKRREIIIKERRDKLNKRLEVLKKKISEIEKEKEELTLGDKRKIKKVLKNKAPEIEYKKEKTDGILFLDMLKVRVRG